MSGAVIAFGLFSILSGRLGYYGDAIPFDNIKEGVIHEAIYRFTIGEEHFAYIRGFFSNRFVNVGNSMENLPDDRSFSFIILDDPGKLTVAQRDAGVHVVLTDGARERIKASTRTFFVGQEV